MKSPFDWRSKPSSLVNDKAFNGVNAARAHRAARAYSPDIDYTPRPNVFSKVRPNEGKKNG